MKTRTELYGKEAKSLLRDITMYRALTEEQVLRLYPGKRETMKNLLSYLTKQDRIYYIDGLYCPTPECAEDVDRGLLAAVWVLADFIDRVEYHSVAEYPAKIIVLSSAGEHPSRYLVLVDDPGQIEQLQIPHASGYCTVSPEGDVHYYQKE